MNSYLVLRISHSLPAILVILGLLAHIVILWNANRNNKADLAKKIYRTRIIVVPVMALLTLSVAVTGWWLMHLSGRPLSQFWLFWSINLLPLVYIALGMLYIQLTHWQLRHIQPKPTESRAPLLALIWAVIALLALLAITALMGAKPL